MGKLLPPPQHLCLRKIESNVTLLRSEASPWWRKEQTEAEELPEDQERRGALQNPGVLTLLLDRG